MSAELNDQMNACLEFARSRQLNVPEQVIFGNESLAQLAERAAPLTTGRRAFILTGSDSALSAGVLDRVDRLLAESGFLKVSRFAFHGEPDVPTVDRAATSCRQEGADLVIGLGGGSVLDCAKAVAGMSCHAGSVFEYLEGVGSKTLSGLALPSIAIPTVSGTGAEMTRNAVISVTDRRVKRSLRHQSIMPRLAIVDPALTATVPTTVTATSGMDGVTQLIESSVSAKRRPETIELALRGLRVVREGLIRCHTHPGDLDGRARVAFASSLGGICLANSGLGLVHGIASGLGGHRKIPHGLICAVLLPHALKYNRDAVPAELRASLAAFLGRSESASTVDDGIAGIQDLNATLGIPADLSFIGLNESEIEEVAHDSMGSSMSGNPVPMTVESVVEFLKRVC